MNLFDGSATVTRLNCITVNGLEARSGASNDITPRDVITLRDLIIITVTVPFGDILMNGPRVKITTLLCHALRQREQTVIIHTFSEQETKATTQRRAVFNCSALLRAGRHLGNLRYQT